MDHWQSLPGTWMLSFFQTGHQCLCSCHASGRARCCHPLQLECCLRQQPLQVLLLPPEVGLQCSLMQRQAPAAVHLPGKRMCRAKLATLLGCPAISPSSLSLSSSPSQSSSLSLSSSSSLSSMPSLSSSLSLLSSRPLSSQPQIASFTTVTQCCRGHTLLILRILAARLLLPVGPIIVFFSLQQKSQHPVHQL